MTRKLGPSARVAVIGGGPGGAFFTMYLLRFAQEACQPVEVTLYEPRPFWAQGPMGCNRCAGVLSASLLRNLKELNLELPPRVVQNHISSYTLHSPHGTMALRQPDPQAQIVSVFRGGGPQRLSEPLPVSFDDFLLSQARERGARVVEAHVRRVEAGPSLVVETALGREPYDLVTLATGTNPGRIALEGLNYTPPLTARMAQDELYLGKRDVQQYLGGSVHVFLLPGTDLVFGTLTPKGDFVNVSLLGQGLASDSIDCFLAHPLVKAILPPEYSRSCGCTPHIAVGTARNPWGDGFVAVGDACVTRLYKDGIGSALITARQAAWTAVFRGIGRADFERGYRPLVQRMAQDNRYGRILFAINDLAERSAAVFAAHAQLAEREWEQEDSSKPFNRILWGMFTGSSSYRDILGQALAPRFVTRLGAQVMREKLAA
ncbi:MAG: hypothetical protein HY687_03870 [Chloroflexi bacterium]|nr:hypothetical protein [Chloroflexota bacterium]